MNLLGPAIETKEPASSLQASTTRKRQEIQDPGPLTHLRRTRTGIATRLRIPPVVTLDEFGQGSIVLTPVRRSP